MKKIFVAVALSAALGGCAGINSPMDDGYQLGDITATVVEAQTRYCATSDPYQRAIALALLHQAGASIPSRGACTDLLTLIPEAEIEGVDVEAAKQDQRQAQEALGE